MVEKQNASKNEPIGHDTAPKAEDGASVEHPTESAQTDPPPLPTSNPVTPADHRPRWKRTLAIGVLAAVVLAAIWKFGVPWIELTLNTVSTDDAYVNGHVTFVAARVRGQVARVLVDDNNRVHKGDILAELDKEPYQDAVAGKRPPSTPPRRTCKPPRLRRAAWKRKPGACAGNCNTPWRTSTTGWPCCTPALPASIKATPRSSWRKLSSHARSNCCRLEREPSRSMTGGKRACRQPRPKWRKRMAEIHQIRVSLGLPAQPESGDLGEVPPDLDQTFSSVLEAQAALFRGRRSSALSIPMNSCRSRWSSSSRAWIRETSTAPWPD